jgi:hypothetical protein
VSILAAAGSAAAPHSPGMATAQGRTIRIVVP